MRSPRSFPGRTVREHGKVSFNAKQPGATPSCSPHGRRVTAEQGDNVPEPPKILEAEKPRRGTHHGVRDKSYKQRLVDRGPVRPAGRRTRTGGWFHHSGGRPRAEAALTGAACES